MKLSRLIAATVILAALANRSLSDEPADSPRAEDRQESATAKSDEELLAVSWKPVSMLRSGMPPGEGEPQMDVWDFNPDDHGITIISLRGTPRRHTSQKLGPYPEYYPEMDSQQTLLVLERAPIAE